MDTTNNKTSLLVSNQLPRFVREEHETFVKFLEYYYKFLEQDGHLTYVSKNFTNFLNPDLIAQDIFKDSQYGDIHGSREDETYHIFLQKMYDTYLKLIPDRVLADRVLLLKHAKEFYTSRGSERSIRFLFRALYDKEVNFYYPKKDILRASDGKWFIERSLKITDVQVNNVSNSQALSHFVNQRVVGETTNAYATVERVESYYDQGRLINELRLSNINRTFVDGERIFTYFVEEGEEKYLTANLFSGVVTSVTIKNAGNNYVEGATIPVESNTGSGAQIVVSRTSKGSIKSIGIFNGGAGFQVNNSILFTGGGGGTGAVANVLSVFDDGNTHPNSYQIISTIIDLEANTTIGNITYSNLVSTIVDPANSWISNSMSYWTYANTGPLKQCLVISGGNNYTVVPTVDVISNTVVRSIGILGRMEIVNGGVGYVVGDDVEIYNTSESFGAGAFGKVTQVDSNGSITQVQFVQVPGHIIGGAGYEQAHLPVANVVSTNTSAYGANVQVTATLGDGEILAESLASIGSILELKILSGGSGYKTAPTLNLASIGDGTAQAIANIVTGVYTYPGRYLNDDGMISSFNFLEDRDYYQNFSYVIKTDESITNYRKYLKDLIHPAGMKLYGEYVYEKNANLANTSNLVLKDANTNVIVKRYNNYYVVQNYRDATYNVDITKTTYTPVSISGRFYANTANVKGTFIANGSNVVITLNSHGLEVNTYIFCAFSNASTSNTDVPPANDLYVISFANTNKFTVTNKANISNGALFGNVYIYNPIVTIATDNIYVNKNDDVYITFDTSSYQNTTYSIYAANSAAIRFLSKNVHTASVNSGNAIAYTKAVNIFVGSHGFSTGDEIYLSFNDGATSNTINGHQLISNIPNSNVFTVVTKSPAISSGNVYVYDNQITVNLANHNAANSSNVYLSFTSGDLANTHNGVYDRIVVNSDLFIVNTSSFVLANGTVKVYLSGTTYDNVVFYRPTHGFSNTDNLYVEFESAVISNGIYTVGDVYSSSTYNIKHRGITVTQNVAMEGVAVIGLYK